MQDIQKSAARTSVDSLTQKLTRCIDALKVHVTAEGRLDDADQHAVRILESRIRFLERLYNYLYGTEEEKAIANIEMNLVHKRDDGTLVQLGEKKHAQGRMDCRACDREEVEVVNHMDGDPKNNAISNLERRMIQRTATRLCTRCLSGIQHTYVERTEGQLEGYPAGDGVIIPPVVVNALGAPNDGDKPILAVVQHRKCDNCGHDDLTLVGYEYPEPKKERWRQVML